MLTAITILHILISILLISAVLLQDPKGGAMGLMGGGGGSQSVFGATGASNFLTKATKWLAICFGVTCILLTYFTSHSNKSVTDSLIPAATAPATNTAPANEAAPATEAPPAEKPAQ